MEISEKYKYFSEVKSAYLELRYETGLGILFELSPKDKETVW